MIYDHRLTQIESATSKGKNIDEDDTNDTNAMPIKFDPKQDMFLGMMQIVTAHKWYLYPPIILRTPFINGIYSFTSITTKGFFATYKDQNISYTFITDPISRDINALFNIKQKHIDSCQLELFSLNIFDTLKSTKCFLELKIHIVTHPYEDNLSEDDIPMKSRPCQMNAELVEFCKKEIDNLLMDPPWVTKGRSRGNNSQGRGRSSRGSSSASLYGSSSNTLTL
ncbi:hypothetical protein H5410_002651 [Solanum commersonii]|uniref:Uncharacterized protein n=1 Tax=Solanum commersonii TaxID=4109 RepID=A0A9J6B2J3_SOLCO|nr:hypothetical protein H5410_002651 [Solanum commersonii]